MPVGLAEPGGLEGVRPARSRSPALRPGLRASILALALVGAVATAAVSLAGPPAPGRMLLTLLALLFLASALPVVLLRWVRPPTTAFMIRARRGGGRGLPLRHEWVPYEEISGAMRLAAIGAEDARFVSHAGFDWAAIRRAARQNREGGPRLGASTITQQVAKNLFLWPGRSYLRKAMEAYFTVLIEAAWPKRRILEVYLNVAQFGSDVFGVGAASRALLGKDAASLGPKDAAMLAAALPSPGRYDVRRPPPRVRLRQVMIMTSVRRLDLDPDRL